MKNFIEDIGFAMGAAVRAFKSAWEDRRWLRAGHCPDGPQTKQIPF